MRKNRRRFRWDRLAYCVLTTTLAIFMGWMTLSYFNTVSNNTDADPVYASWNLFSLMF